MSNSNPRPSALRFPVRRLLLSVVPALVLVLTACSTIAPYDQAAYEHATSSKAEALLLMDRATTSYSQNTDKIDAVILDLNKAYEYDKGRARNQFTVKLWTELLSPDNLFGAFIHQWKSKGQLHPGYIEVKKKDVEDAFDQIIQLEQGKQKTGI
jgi:outer membrane PBP1 activator LpoA protein